MNGSGHESVAMPRVQHHDAVDKRIEHGRTGRFLRNAFRFTQCVVLGGKLIEPRRARRIHDGNAAGDSQVLQSAGNRCSVTEENYARETLFTQFRGGDQRTIVVRLRQEDSARVPAGLR